MPWWIDFHWRGQRFREPGGRTKAEAEGRLQKRQEEVKGEIAEPDYRRAPFTVEDLRKLWLASPRARRKKSLDDDQQRFAVLEALLGTRTQVDTIRRSDIDGPGGLIARLRDGEGSGGRKLSDATVNRYLALARSAFRYAADQGHEHREPLAGIKLTREPHRKRTCSPAELEALLERADPETRLAIVLAHETGMRLSELVGLERGQIKGQLVTLSSAETKTAEERTVPLSERAAAALRAAPGTEGRVFAVSASVISNRFHRLCESLKIEGLRFHDLRRTAATNLRRAGVDLMTIASITGHKSLEMLRRYQEVLDEDKLAAVQRMTDHREGAKK